MRRLLLLAGCSALLIIPLFAFAEEEPDPEPAPAPDAAIKRLDDAVGNVEKIGRDKVEAQRKQLVARLEKMHANLAKRGKEKQARELKDRILLAGSLEPGHGLDTKLTVPKLLEKASGSGRYRELLHVLYLPGDKAGYGDYTDYGFSATGAWGGYNNLTHGHWVYVYPRWYIWKELKP
jgi:hypothetical protein